MDEYVVVVYPDDRAVYLDGQPFGRTGQLLTVQRGTHTFALGLPVDYRPLQQSVLVKDTSMDADGQKKVYFEKI